jgi:hypothetical protein
MDTRAASNWIQPPVWTEEDSKLTRVVFYRKTICLARCPESFPVRITACSRYKLYVNGALAACGPAKGDGRIWFVDELDLAAFLQGGENTLAAAVFCPPENPAVGNHSLFRFGKPLLYAEGLGTSGWKCQVDRTTYFPREEERFAPMQIHELAAPDAGQVNWQSGTYDDSTWDCAVLCPLAELPEVLHEDKLAPRDIPFPQRTMHRFELPVQTVEAGETVSFTLDAGEEMCAFLRLGLSGGRGAQIELLQSECYVLPDGQKGNRLDSLHGHLEGYTDHYTVAGAENEVYEPFWFRTFRFLRLTVKTADEPLTLRFLDYEETGYPLEFKSNVTVSDASFAPIWDISLRTLRRCMHETYMDCPFYEQLQYAMDTRSQILYTYAISADDRLARRAIDDFSRAQRPDGLLNCSYPNVNVNVIPGFSMYYILMVHDHMLYFGDWTLVRQSLPTIHRALSFFADHLTGEGLVGQIGGVNGKAPFWSFIDWAEDWMPTEGMPSAGLYGPITMESLLYLLGLQRAAELCIYVGDDRAALYRAQAEKLRETIRSHCLDGEGLLADGPGRPERSQHAQVFGVLTGVLNEEEGRRALLCSMEDPGMTGCTVAMCFYLFRALEQTGLYAYTDRFWDIWRRMIDNGCTTCVEAEYYARSECHAWGALALYELPSAVLGVRPAAPGYAKIAVEPQPGNLTHASGMVHTPRGDVQVSWELVDGQLCTEIDCAEELKKDIIRAKEAK